MLTLPSSVRVYLAAEPVDLRRGHDGLVAIVRSEWQLNPFDGHLFVFLGRRLDCAKILVWDRNGFVLYYKRLSQGRFRMPKIPVNVSRVELDAVTDLFESAARIRALRDGPDGMLLCAFAGVLVQTGYAPLTVHRHLRAAEHFVHWADRVRRQSSARSIWL
jgi:transposase